MRITAICTCVNFADLLAKSLDRWHVGTERLVIITSSADKATQELCRANNVECFVTDIFYECGAKFNKGAAMSEAEIALGLRKSSEWLLTFDSDIVPPMDWRQQLEGSRIHQGKLYGAWRYQQPEHGPIRPVDYSKRMRQGWVLGFFSLFYALDFRLPAENEPIWDICWPHAGNYDTTFTKRWPKHDQVFLPIPMIHLGEERANWTGRGQKHELHGEFFRHRKGIEDYDHEKLKELPSLQKSVARLP